MMFVMTVIALTLGAGMYWFTHWMTVQLLDWHLKRDKRLHELYAMLPTIRAIVRKEREDVHRQPVSQP
jgi:hypothetical protein